MPHRNSSCRKWGNAFLRNELELLYARRLQVEEAIRELETTRSLWKMGQDHSPLDTARLEFAANLCNLTNCRSA